MKKNKLFVNLVVGACIFGAHLPSLGASHPRTPGEKVDNAIDSAKDKIDKAKDKAKEGIDKAKDKTKEGIDKTKDGLDKVKDKIGR